MTDEVRTEVEQIKQQEDVKQALKQTTGAKEKMRLGSEYGGLEESAESHKTIPIRNSNLHPDGEL